MTPLRQRMIEDMEIRNFSPNTQLAYLQQVSGFAKYCHRSPEQVGPEEIRAYQVHLTTERKLAALAESAQRRFVAAGILSGTLESRTDQLLRYPLRQEFHRCRLYSWRCQPLPPLLRPYPRGRQHNVCTRPRKPQPTLLLFGLRAWPRRSMVASCDIDGRPTDGSRGMDPPACPGAGLARGCQRQACARQHFWCFHRDARQRNHVGAGRPAAGAVCQVPDRPAGGRKPDRRHP